MQVGILYAFCSFLPSTSCLRKSNRADWYKYNIDLSTCCHCTQLVSCSNSDIRDYVSASSLNGFNIDCYV